MELHLHKEIAKPCFILSKGAKSSFTSPLHSILAPNRRAWRGTKWPTCPELYCGQIVEVRGLMEPVISPGLKAATNFL
jgi:hypothetical protein